MPAQIKSCLPPVVTPQTRLLLLGSLPGDASLAAEQYYAHPQNQFWRLLGAVLDQPLAALPYADRLDRLRARGVGLWDTVAAAERPGSLDQAMRKVAANALPELIAGIPHLAAVGFNGKTAARFGLPALAGRGLALIELPSSSPANTQPLADKLAIWSRLAEWVLPPQGA